MKIKTLLLAMTALWMQQAAWADGGVKPTLTINGQPQNAQVKTITFSGTQANITYEDGTQTTAALSELAIVMERNTTGINQTLKDRQSADRNAYTTDGRNTGNKQTPRQKGIYIIGGKKILVK